MAPKDEVLSIVGGDFNYVTDSGGRRCATLGASTGHGDKREDTSWRNLLEMPRRLREMHQPDMTCAFPLSRSRSDRMCCNQDVVEGFDRHLQCGIGEVLQICSSQGG